MIPIVDNLGNVIFNTDFFVNNNNILEPLGVLVTRDSRYELLPATRDNAEEIPGMHGEIDFGTTYKSRFLELDVISPNGGFFRKKDLIYLYAKYLNPTMGVKSLVFADDIDKVYYVKYSGKIDITQYANWFKFVIPFKMTDPFAYGITEKSLVGNGVLINEGTFETGLKIEIAGPATNPTLTIGSDILTYNGTLISEQVLTIDTQKGTAKIGNVNAMDNYNGVFPLLYPDNQLIVSATSNITIKWRDKWQ